ncbi:sce7726 family protein [Pseudoalteromonas sp. Z9A5]|jgi:hypothetical protein|uniref:sce7726 family protein n=1 Tax=Pseudoalteromonas sp. Z9A5 TaxID=2686355 RepID=UPI00140C6ECB|nr:sce7726 family protein [Pseudoalteromonas sp. Z9A5]
MSSQLNDPVIRCKLKSYLESLPVKPRAVIDELHVHRGNAIADVVAVYKEPHCFEIKGETDNIYRLKSQGKFYDLVFKKITLVTTENHLKNALASTPNHWGIIVAFLDQGKVKFRHLRKTKSNPHFSKKYALLTLWKQEMLNVGSLNKIELPKKINKSELVLELANHLTKEKVNTEIANSLFSRTIF